MTQPSLSRRRFVAIASAAFAAGCGGHERFVLPAPQGERTALRAPRWNVRPGPVLTLGAPGAWDGADVLNPSVLFHQGIYYNFYSGYDGKTWHTGLATSPDGIGWRRQGKILSPDPASWEGDYIAANGAALARDGEFLYWYQGNRLPAIGLARSQTGRSWTKHSGPVLRPGPRGSWDERGVADPYVIRAGDFYYMYFLGQDRARRQRLGLARSLDGVRWRKLLSNPILELGEPGAFDENGLGEPAVWAWQGRYWMAYTGRDRREYRRIGLAWSEDGVRWRRLPPETVFEGRESWNSKVVCDPSVLVEGGRIRVWFGGGDVATPAENLNGQIGYATLESADANLSE